MSRPGRGPPVLLVHLLRELLKVDDRNDSAEWKAFSKQLKRLIRDGLRLRKRPDYTPERYRSRFALIYHRLDALAGAAYTDPDARRIAKRISKHRDHLFTFLDRLDVPSDNNGGEREIRPAVQMRKNILGNRSQNGAHIQGVLMSIFRTLKLRGHDPTTTIVAALREMLQTGNYPVASESCCTRLKCHFDGTSELQFLPACLTRRAQDRLTFKRLAIVTVLSPSA